MEDNKKKIPDTTITRNTALFSQMTENIYETVAVLTKRANQIAIEEKKELKKQIEEFTTNNDLGDEYYENREQVETVRRFERMPKPVLTATEEYLDQAIYYRNPAKEDLNQQKMEEMENKVIANQK
ncbi:MAG: DNA-directed RNA polymerase subunit omega [Bacteroidales bacterium]|nr:DNA-directed RNA polymerase subunit omega [Bacteroidales bacterium]